MHITVSSIMIHPPGLALTGSHRYRAFQGLLEPGIGGGVDHGLCDTGKHERAFRHASLGEPLAAQMAKPALGGNRRNAASTCRIASAIYEKSGSLDFKWLQKGAPETPLPGRPPAIAAPSWRFPARDAGAYPGQAFPSALL